MASELSLVKTLLRLVPETNIIPGQYIACTDSTRAFYDISDGVRIEVNFSIEAQLVPDYITDRVLGKVYYLEPVQRFYVYEATGFRRIFTNEEADALYGSYSMVPFTMENQITGMKLAPRTLASCVYTSSGESVEALIANTYRLGNYVALTKINYSGTSSVLIPFPFDEYFAGGNIMDVYLNGIRLNRQSDYTISADGMLVFLDPSNIRVNDVVTFDFTFNSTNISGSERYQTVIEGGYITKYSIPTNRLASTTSSYLIDDASTVATAAAVNGVYNKLNDKIDDIATNYRGVYKTVSSGTGDTIVLTIPDINLQDGTEINVKLTRNLNNNAVVRLNTLAETIVYVNGTRATGLYKKGDYICLVYSAEQNAYNVKLYCDYKITTHSYATRVDANLGIIPFYIPQYLPGITTLRVYQNNLRLFDDINYVVYDNTIRLLDYTTNDGDLFVFEVDTVEKYYL